MTPWLLFLYGLAVAGGLFCVGIAALVIFLLLCWLLGVIKGQ